MFIALFHRITKSIWFVIFIGVSICNGCSTPPLQLYSEYITVEDLASYHVETPDPKLDDPPFGQRVVIKWRLPSSRIVDFVDLHCVITGRFLNGQERRWNLNLASLTGTSYLRFVNEEYLQTGGLVAYKGDLYYKNQLLYCWRHQLWNETITVGPAD